MESLLSSLWRSSLPGKRRVTWPPERQVGQSHNPGTSSKNQNMNHHTPDYDYFWVKPSASRVVTVICLSVQRRFVSLISEGLKGLATIPSCFLASRLSAPCQPTFSFCFLSHGESVVTVGLCHILPVMHDSSSSLCARGQFRKLLFPSFPSEIPSDGESEQVLSRASS